MSCSANTFSVTGKSGETVTFHTSRFTAAHTLSHTRRAASVCTHMTSHRRLIVRVVNNCSAWRHDCDPGLVFKGPLLVWSQPSSPWRLWWGGGGVGAGAEITLLMSSEDLQPEPHSARLELCTGTCTRAALLLSDLRGGAECRDKPAGCRHLILNSNRSRQSCCLHLGCLCSYRLFFTFQSRISF